MTFYELEKKCKKRRFLKIFFIFFLILIFIFLGFFYYFNYSKSKKVLKKEIQIKKTAKIIKKINKIQQKEITIFPSIDLNITKNQQKTNRHNDKNNTIKKEIILKAFNIPSYKTCISMALKYLQQKNYQNALKWAKYANTQNKKEPMSWIVTAKALYYLGQRNNAIKLLKIYNSYYNNKNIKKLIKEMGDK